MGTTSALRPERSASSSGTEKRFEAFLVESFALLQREAESFFCDLTTRLARRRLVIDVDGEQTGLSFAVREIMFGPPGDDPDIVIRTRSEVILSVLDANASLLDAVLDDELCLRATLGHLALFHDALLAYVHGAVRSPSFPSLLQRFRARCRATIYPIDRRVDQSDRTLPDGAAEIP